MLEISDRALSLKRHDHMISDNVTYFGNISVTVTYYK